MNSLLLAFREARPYEQLAVVLVVLGFVLSKLGFLAVILSFGQEWTWPFWFLVFALVVLKTGIVVGIWDHVKIVRRNWRERVKEAYGPVVY